MKPTAGAVHTNTSAKYTAKANGPVLVSLADVKPEQVSWLWPRRLAGSKLNLLVGDPGTGKTFVALDMMARVSQGAPWPDEGHAPQGNSLLLTAEDGLADTIRPRLEALGANVHAVTALEAVRRNGNEVALRLDDDLNALWSAVQKTHAILVVVDPLSAYLGKADPFKDSEVRGVLAPLAHMAEQENLAVLGIVHLTKDTQRRAISRIQGSMGFVAAARVALAVGRDPREEPRRFLMPLKNNLTTPALPLAFHLANDRIEWEQEPVESISTEEVLSGAAHLAEADNEMSPKMAEAIAFLRGILFPGPTSQSVVKNGAEFAGIADRTLWRAKKLLGVIAARSGSFTDRDDWLWTLPESPQDCQNDQSCQPDHGEDDTTTGGPNGE